MGNDEGDMTQTKTPHSLRGHTASRSIGMMTAAAIGATSPVALLCAIQRRAAAASRDRGRNLRAAGRQAQAATRQETRRGGPCPPRDTGTRPCTRRGRGPRCCRPRRARRWRERSVALRQPRSRISGRSIGQLAADATAGRYTAHCYRRHPGSAARQERDIGA